MSTANVTMPEIVLLRHQLNVLRRRVPSKPKLAVAFKCMAALAHTAVVVVMRLSCALAFGAMAKVRMSVPKTLSALIC
jgi:hypothetical protein